MDGYQRGLALMVYKLFAKKPSWGVVTEPSFMSISSLVLDYDNFSLQEIDQKSGNRNNLCLSFA